MDCLFCKIASKEIPSEIVYENESAVAFLDIHPCTPGHTVIIPKSHAENIITLEEKHIGPLFLAVKAVTKKIDSALQPQGFTPLEVIRPKGPLGAQARARLLTGFTIGINHGILAGQTIEHLHIHVIPRYRDDGGGSLHSIVHMASDMPLVEIAKRIKA